MSKYEIQQLHEGDIVEFPRHQPENRFAIVTGGFGMSPKLAGSKIFGVLYCARGSINYPGQISDLTCFQYIGRFYLEETLYLA